MAISLSSFLFDVHTHTQFAAYADDKDAVIRRALDAGVWMVNVGTQQDTSAAAVKTAHQYPEGVYATVGLHPVHTEKSYHDEQELGATFSHSQECENVGFTSRGEGFDYEYYKKLAGDSKVVAIGECGLDYYRLGEETKGRQRDAFLKQIELSRAVEKPLMIHCRNAFRDLIDVLVSCRMSLVSRPGIIHFFSGTVDDAKRLLDLDFSFSFGGVITFARDYDEVVRYIPIERIVLETDAPYITPVPYRGRRNEPVYIIETAKKLAELKTLSYETTARMTTENARTIFQISVLGSTQSSNWYRDGLESCIKGNEQDICFSHTCVQCRAPRHEKQDDVRQGSRPDSAAMSGKEG